MTLQSVLFDKLSNAYGNGSVEHILFLQNEPPCAVRIAVRVRNMRRIFLAAIEEVDGNGTIDTLEISPIDEETVISTHDDVALTVTRLLGEAMAEREEV